MNIRAPMPMRIPSKVTTVTNRQYILFTWSKCKQCQEMKNNIRSHLQSGRIIEYDLDTLRNNQELMSLFLRTSPTRNVPAMAILSNGSYERGIVGVSQIMGSL